MPRRRAPDKEINVPQLTDQALRAALEAKRAAAVAYLGKRYVLAQSPRLSEIREARREAATIPVREALPVLWAFHDGAIAISGPDQAHLTDTMNALGRAIRSAQGGA